MTSSSWSAQLSLWRQIISELHEGTKPLNQRHDFMTKRFDELDSKGFVWSKESMLEIFLQLDLSGSTHGAFSSDKKITEPRVSEGLDVIHTKESPHQPRTIGLMDLPIEVFEEILKQLDNLQVPSELLYRKRSPGQVILTGPESKTPYYTYLYRDSPILNDTQSFSLTSREIYRRCVPWLWRKVKFPTALPAPVDLWTKDILRKQCVHVRSPSLGPSENSPDEIAEYDPWYDNLSTVPKVHSKMISPKNVKDSITLRPEISTLDLLYECDKLDDDEGGREAFLLDLLPQLSNLKHLRHFKLVDHYQGSTLSHFPSRIVSMLPLLESLTICAATVPGDQQTHDYDLPSTLSELKYLSRLEIAYTGGVDEYWRLYDWPRTITDLEFCCCYDLRPSSAYRIIHHIAPHVVNLKLYFAYKGDDDAWEFEGNWRLQSHLSFPSLIDLSLSTRNIFFMVSFGDCKSLRRFEYTCRAVGHCKVLKRWLSEAPWPQLKKLEVLTHRLRESGKPRKVIQKEILSLEKLCEHINTNETVQRPFDWRMI